MKFTMKTDVSVSRYSFCVVAAFLILQPAHADVWSDARDKGKQTVRGAGEIAKQGVKDLGNGVSSVGKATAEVVDATVGEVARTGGKGVQEVGDIAAKGVHEAGKGAKNIVDGTMHEVMRAGHGISVGASDAWRKAKENPFETLIIVAACAYGGYLVYSGDFVFSVSLQGYVIPIAEGGAAKAAGAGLVVVAANQARKLDENEGKAPTTPTETAPQSFQITKLPGVPEWKTLPELPPTDQQKMQYVREVQKWLEKNPPPAVIGVAPTIQEIKAVEALTILSTVAPTPADAMAKEKTDMAIADDLKDATIDVIKEGTSKAGTAAAAGKILVDPTATSDGTLVGEPARESMRNAIAVELSRYNMRRALEHKLVDDEHIEKVLEQGRQPMLKPALP
jgi:hypothetical protein